MKKSLLAILLLSLVLALAGCGKSSDSSSSSGSEGSIPAMSEDTLGGKYYNAFVKSSGADAASVVDDLIALGAFESELVKMDVEPGYLNGFSAEIDGFTKGSMFSPMIGSIPFVGYVFESDDPEALKTTLEANADQAWNICTMADETVTCVKGNLVFFMMCSNEA